MVERNSPALPKITKPNSTRWTLGFQKIESCLGTTWSQLTLRSLPCSNKSHTMEDSHVSFLLTSKLSFVITASCPKLLFSFTIGTSAIARSMRFLEVGTPTFLEKWDDDVMHVCEHHYRQQNNSYRNSVTKQLTPYQFIPQTPTKSFLPRLEEYHKVQTEISLGVQLLGVVPSGWGIVNGPVPPTATIASTVGYSKAITQPRLRQPSTHSKQSYDSSFFVHYRSHWFKRCQNRQLCSHLQWKVVSTSLCCVRAPQPRE